MIQFRNHSPDLRFKGERSHGKIAEGKKEGGVFFSKTPQLSKDFNVMRGEREVESENPPLP